MEEGDQYASLSFLPRSRALSTPEPLAVCLSLAATNRERTVAELSPMPPFCLSFILGGGGPRPPLWGQRRLSVSCSSRTPNAIKPAAHAAGSFILLFVLFSFFFLPE